MWLGVVIGFSLWMFNKEVVYASRGDVLESGVVRWPMKMDHAASRWPTCLCRWAMAALEATLAHLSSLKNGLSSRHLRGAKLQRATHALTARLSWCNPQFFAVHGKLLRMAAPSGVPRPVHAFQPGPA